MTIGPHDEGGRPADVELVALLATDLHRDRDETRTLRTIFDHVPLVLAGAQHAAIVVGVPTDVHGRRGAASSVMAETADLLQQEMREGAGLDTLAADGPRWLVSHDAGTDPRWPRWGPAIAALGLHSLMSIQLREAGETVGALTMYAAARGAFRDDGDLASTVRWAGHAATAWTTARLVTELELAITTAHVLGVARGIVMARLDCDEAWATGFLDRVATARHEELGAVAGRLVSTRSLPADPGTTGPETTDPGTTDPGTTDPGTTEEHA